MESVWVSSPTTVLQNTPWWRALWPADRIAIVWFAYLAILATARRHLFLHISLPLAFAAALGFASVWETRNSRPWTRILREWLLLGIILPAYWSLEWFSTPQKWMPLQQLWLSWDRVLLDSAGLRAIIESCGPTLPFVLETAYLLLYIMPVAALIILQRSDRREHRQRFLQTLFLGTFTAYAILPLVAVESPRRVFPQQDEPRILTAPRQINLSVLDNLDISTGVFPSGHVAVAFSTAFGLFSFARREGRRFASRLAVATFAMATLVFLATIYGRYHYAADSLASLLIAATAWRIVEMETEMQSDREPSA